MGESEAGDGTGYDSVTTESTRIEAVEGDGAGYVLAEVTETEACDRAGLVDQAAESEGTDRRTDSMVSDTSEAVHRQSDVSFSGDLITNVIYHIIIIIVICVVQSQDMQKNLSL